MTSFTPTWQAASATFGANAGHVNQFLTTHSSTFSYTGNAIKSQHGTGIAVYSDTLTQMLSTSFITTSTQVAVGSVNVQLSTIGGSPTLPLINPITFSIYADLGGLPTGSALVSNTVSNNYVYSSPFWVTIPLPVGGLASLTTYHIVATMVGTASHYYVWQRSNQGTGAATSVNGGATWVAQTYGLMYQILDQTNTGLIQYIYEDGGARTIQLSYNSQNRPTQITEFTSAQATAGYLQGTRNINYTNGFVTGVS
jgi:hypothetical protein